MEKGGKGGYSINKHQKWGDKWDARDICMFCGTRLGYLTCPCFFFLFHLLFFSLTYRIGVLPWTLHNIGIKGDAIGCASEPRIALPSTLPKAVEEEKRGPEDVEYANKEPLGAESVSREAGRS